MSDVPEILSEGHVETDQKSSRDAQSQGPTESHVISKTQVEGQETKEISDIGWGQEFEIDGQITPGLPNEDLWMLLRRFDQVSSKWQNSLIAGLQTDCAATVLCQDDAKSAVAETGSPACRGRGLFS